MNRQQLWPSSKDQDNMAVNIYFTPIINTITVMARAPLQPHVISEHYENNNMSFHCIVYHWSSALTQLSQSNIMQELLFFLRFGTPTIAIHSYTTVINMDSWTHALVMIDDCLWSKTTKTITMLTHPNLKEVQQQKT